MKVSNFLFTIKPPIQSDKVKIAFKIFKVNIATMVLKVFKINITIMVFKVSEAIVTIYIDLTIYNTINLLTHTDEFKTDSIDLPSFKEFIATETSEASEVSKTIMVNSNINIITELFI